MDSAEEALAIPEEAALVAGPSLQREAVVIAEEVAMTELEAQGLTPTEV